MNFGKAKKTASAEPEVKTVNNSNTQKGTFNGKCLLCGAVGHKMVDCLQAGSFSHVQSGSGTAGGSAPRNTQPVMNYGNQSRGGTRPASSNTRNCTWCRSADHGSRQCPVFDRVARFNEFQRTSGGRDQPQGSQNNQNPASGDRGRGNFRGRGRRGRGGRGRGRGRSVNHIASEEPLETIEDSQESVNQDEENGSLFYYESENS